MHWADGERGNTLEGGHHLREEREKEQRMDSVGGGGEGANK